MFQIKTCAFQRLLTQWDVASCNAARIAAWLRVPNLFLITTFMDICEETNLSVYIPHML